MIIVFIRSIILYVIIIFAVRLMGKRQIGELQPSELVITILVSNIATLPIEDLNLPMIMGVIPMLTLVCLDVFMSMASMKSKRLRKVISGSPKVIIKDGIIDQKMLKNLRFSIDDLVESMREKSIFDLNEIQFAIVETTGSLSFYQKSEFQNPTLGDLKIKQKNQNPPEILINDGVLIENALSAINLGQGWLYGILSDKNVSLKDVFLFTADETGKFKLIKKEY